MEIGRPDKSEIMSKEIGFQNLEVIRNFKKSVHEVNYTKRVGDS